MFKKTGLSIVLILFVLMSTAGFLLSANKARAFPVETAIDLPRQVSEMKDAIKGGWKAAVINAAIKAVAYFTRKIAYDTAANCYD